MTKKTNHIPIRERTLHLIFDSPEDVHQWIAWYIDGGEGTAEYYTNLKGSDFNRKDDKILVLERTGSYCPKCKSINVLDTGNPEEYNQKRVQYYSKGRKLKREFLCEDCLHNFDIET